MNTFLGAMGLGEKVTQMVSSVVQELSRVFPNIGGNDDGMEGVQSLRIPTAVEVEDAIETVKNRQRKRRDSAAQSISSERQSIDTSPPLPDTIPPTATELAQQEVLRSLTKILVSSSCNQSPTKSFASSSSSQSSPLTSSTSSSPSSSQSPTVVNSELLETICKLLFMSESNKEEFARIDGYSALLLVFSSKDIVWDTVQTESLLTVIYTTILDGSPTAIITNYDALDMLMTLATTHPSLILRTQSLNTIQDLISINPVNAAILWQLGAIDTLFKMLGRAIHVGVKEERLLGQMLGLETEWNIAAQVEEALAAEPLFPYVGRFWDTEPGQSVAGVVRGQVYRFLRRVMRLVDYVGVILSEAQFFVLLEYTRLLMEVPLPSPNPTTNLILHSVSKLISDLLSRHRPVDAKFLSIFLQLVRRIWRMDSDAAGLLEGMEEEEEKEQEEDEKEEEGEEVKEKEILKGPEEQNEGLKKRSNSFENALHQFDLRNRTESSLPTPPKLQRRESMSPMDYRLREMIMQDQHLLLLHIVALLVEATGRDIESFNILQGFDTLVRVIVLGTKNCMELMGSGSAEIHGLMDVKERVVFFALWMVREYFGGAIKWVIRLLKSIMSLEETPSTPPTPPSTIDPSPSELHSSSIETHTTEPPQVPSSIYAKVCRLVSSLLLRGDDAQEAFGEAGGLQILLAIFSNAHDQSVASASLRALGDLFSGNEETKQLLARTFGYDGLLELILRSSRPLDRLSCEVILEVATIGNISIALNPKPNFIDRDPFMDLGLMPYATAILEPQSLFEMKLPFTCSVRSGIRTSRAKAASTRTAANRLSWAGSRPASIKSARTLHGDEIPQAGIWEKQDGYMDGNATFSEKQSLRTLDTSKRSSLHLTSPTLSISTPPTSGFSTGSVNRDDRATLQTVRRKRSNLSSPLVMDESLISKEMIRFFLGIAFRDGNAAMMVLKFLARITERRDDANLQEYFFNLLALLLELTLRNKQLLCSHNAITFLIELMFIRGIQMPKERYQGKSGFPGEREPPALIDLIPLLGSYTTTLQEVALLFDAAYDPLGIFGHLLDEGFRRPAITQIIDNIVRDSSMTLLPKCDMREVTFDPFFMAEMQMEMMYAIERISERIDPNYYFDFNGIDGQFVTFPLEKFPSAKIGYTLSFWVKVTTFLEDETGLVCFVDSASGGNTLFELYFKKLNLSDRQCLCVRMQHYPSPPEDILFDGFDFSTSCGVWHHIVLVHGKQSTSLLVDGAPIGTFSTFSYPRPTGKEKAFIAIIGRKGKPSDGPLVPNMFLEEDGNITPIEATFDDSNDDQSHILPQTSQLSTYFCGQIGSVYFIKGLWDQPTTEHIFNEGPAYRGGYRALNVDSRDATVLNPIAYTDDFKSHPDRTSITSIRSSFGSAEALARRSWSSIDEPKVVGRLEGGCTVQKVLPMRDIIEDIGGVELCFRFLEMEPRQQIVGLRVLSNLLLKSSTNLARFQDRRSFQALEILLREKLPNLTMDYFEVLFEITSNGVIKNNQMVIVCSECLRVIINLMLDSPESVQLPVLRTIVDMLVEVPENMRQWRLSFGMGTLLDILNSLSSQLRPFIMHVIEAMIDDIPAEDLSMLFDFVTHDQRQFLDIKCDILDMVLKQMSYNIQLVEKIRAARGFTQLIPFLELPSERFRITVLRIIGILMSSNVKLSRATITKANSFDQMRASLAPFQLSADVSQVMFGIAVNLFKCDPVGRVSSASFDHAWKRTPPRSNSPRPSPRASPRTSEEGVVVRNLSHYTVPVPSDELVWPEIIRLILELLRTSESSDLVIHVLTDLKRLMTESNMKLLWEYPWYEWISRFSQYRSMVNAPNYSRIISFVDSIIQKMMIYDLFRKNSHISKAHRNLLPSDASGDDAFQIQIIDNILAYLDKYSTLNIDTATHVFRNLVSLYKCLEDIANNPTVSTITGSSRIITLTRQVQKHFAATVNLLSCQNTSAIRMSMKNSGLFKIRDGLIEQYGMTYSQV